MRRAPPRVAGLDGLRGLAALFVVVHHVFLRAFPGYPADRAPLWARPFIYGRFAVVVFIVLSGFSLALSPARHGWQLGSVAQFAYRRARRMVRHVGTIVMLTTVTLVVAAVGIAAPHVAAVDTFVIQSAPDLAALFAVGILSAGIVGASRTGRAWSWPWLALAAAAPVVTTIWWQGSVWTLDHVFWMDLALGPAVACLLAGFAAGRPARVLRVLEHRPVRNLGLSSYSLYLTHWPIVIVVYERIVVGRVRQGAPAFLVTLGLALPLAILCARLFAAIFERPFQRRPSWRGRLRIPRPHPGVASA